MPTFQHNSQRDKKKRLKGSAKGAISCSVALLYSRKPLVEDLSCALGSNGVAATHKIGKGDGHLLQSLVSIPGLGFEGALGLGSPRELLTQLHTLRLKAFDLLVAAGLSKILQGWALLQ